jgi:hypothetical protein
MKTMSDITFKRGMRLRNKLSTSKWEVYDVTSATVHMICVYSHSDDEVGSDRVFPISELSDERFWMIVENVSPVNKEQEISDHIRELVGDKKPKILTDEEKEHIKRNFSIAPEQVRRLEALNSYMNNRNWIYDVVILEFAEGNKVKAYLTEINEKYLKFTLTCDMCHLTCTKLVADKDEYIKLITSPDEYWDEYIDSFMSKHFKVVEDNENDV